MSKEQPTLIRRRSSRIENSLHPYAITAPTLKKQSSSTASLRGALEGMSASEELAPRRGSVVSAASSRAKFMAMQSEAQKPKKTDKEVAHKNKFDSVSVHRHYSLHN